MHNLLISLPDAHHRRVSAFEQLKRCGIGFEWVAGVEASKYKPECLAIDNRSRTWLKTGEVGCYHGHLQAMRRLVEYGWPYACILEDDFCFEADPDFGLCEIEHFLPNEFHFIHLQRNLGMNPRFRNRGKKGLLASDQRTLGGFDRVCETPFCTSGYIIHRTLAKYILDHEFECRMPIDHLFAELSYRGLFFMTVRPLIGIRGGLGSDIQNSPIIS